MYQGLTDSFLFTFSGFLHVLWLTLSSVSCLLPFIFWTPDLRFSGMLPQITFSDECMGESRQTLRVPSG